MPESKTTPTIKMPEAPLGSYLSQFTIRQIWEIGFKEGLIAYELALQGHHHVKRI